jgi:4-amino-4-deoxy-L-arabinose transferase-like glycosyltransferase
MKGRFSSIYPQKWVLVLLLVGFCLILYFVNLGRWDLWNPDEPRYAQVAREMVQQGDWILMHRNGEVYPDKPPLFFWAIALSSFLWGGFTSFSARFPAALFGTLTVILTFLMGRKIYSSRTGFWSGLILATSFEFAYLSSRANIDTTLTFFTTASFFCFLHWYRTGREEGLNLSLYGFYLGMALATLTKGPVGIALPLLGCLSYLVYLRDWRAIKEMKLFVGLVLLLAVVLLWYAPAVIKGGRAYLEMTLFRQTIDRFSKGWSHVRPFYYYFYNFPVDFLPWTLFLPGAIAYSFSKERKEKRKSFFFLLTWAVVIFISIRQRH